MDRRTRQRLPVLSARVFAVRAQTELSHHSLVQYALPDTGEIISLLQQGSRY